MPLGATTYYFKTLDDLTDAALTYAAELSVEGLRGWAEALDASADLPATLAELTTAYLADRPRVLLESEIYLAAAHRPELRPMARVWFDGLVEILEPHTTTPAAAQAAAVFIDGVLLRALNDTPLDTPTITAALAALLTTVR
ncbi:hypothetical protein GCM10027280_60980 [Micromonospora polyrhachis]|uniref:DNA-binding transcriptional regulator YbjK n=1 Tax=Micromonospora polyrhachis TaxID=1282883 RepID=A0A7W7SU83_9ACTN|nr:TetR family transcriptional regulator [Micromonospora polyrhachis]MBB4960983.1 DNA-binding transcriptional regulator YbjK [Micromonospora polyrhachis]